jgi:hypothetical protein
LVSGITCGSYPSLVTVTVMSALRLATTTQGVTQAVGLSSPDSSAVAPAGVLEIEIFSVVPRVTDAQPTLGTAMAAANTTRIIIYAPPARRNLRATLTGTQEGGFAGIVIMWIACPGGNVPAEKLCRPPVTF